MLVELRRACSYVDDVALCELELRDGKGVELRARAPEEIGDLVAALINGHEGARGELALQPLHVREADAEAGEMLLV